MELAFCLMKQPLLNPMSGKTSIGGSLSAQRRKNQPAERWHGLHRRIFRSAVHHSQLCSFLCLETDLLSGWIYAVVLDGQGCYGLVDGVNLLTHVLRKIIDGFQVVLVISLEKFHFCLDCFKFGSQGRNASIIFMQI